MKMVMADPAVQAVGSFFGGGTGSAVNNGAHVHQLETERLGQGRTQRRRRHSHRTASRQSSRKFPGAQLFLTAKPGHPSRRRIVESAISIRAVRSKHRRAEFVGAKTGATNLREYPQIKDATSDQQFRGLQETVVIDRDAAARLGIQPQAVDSTLYSAFGQRQVSIIYTQQNQYHVILEVDPQFYLDPSSLDKIYVKSNSGSQVPLSTIAHFQLDNTPLSVNHQGQFPCVTISFNIAPRAFRLGEATQIVERAKRELGMPSAIRGSFAGTAQVFSGFAGDRAAAPSRRADRRLHRSRHALRKSDSSAHDSFHDALGRTRRVAGHARDRRTNSISSR